MESYFIGTGSRVQLNGKPLTLSEIITIKEYPGPGWLLATRCDDALIALGICYGCRFDNRQKPAYEIRSLLPEIQPKELESTLDSCAKHYGCSRAIIVEELKLLK